MGGHQDLATQLLQQYGYAGLSLSLFLNCVGLPVASEATLPLAGMLSRSGTLNLPLVLVLALISQMVGVILTFFAARHGGFELLDRYGHFLFIRHSYLVKLRQLFKKHGDSLIFLGACLPGTHGYVGYAAGLAKMNFGLFLVLATAGMVVWTSVLVGLGWFLSDHLSIMDHVSYQLGFAVVLAVVLAGVAFWYSRQHARGRRKKETS
jgi:membrane protein DedA with SNARE-associated domain